MNETESKKRKWVALAVLILFLITGGVYRVISRKSASLQGASSTTGTNEANHSATTPPQPSTSNVAGSSSPASASNTTALSRATSLANQNTPSTAQSSSPATGVAVGAAVLPTMSGTNGSTSAFHGASATPGTITPGTAAAAVESQGFFARLFGGFSKKAPSNTPGLLTPSIPGTPSLAIGSASTGTATTSGTAADPQKLGEKVAAVPAPPADDCLTLTYHRKSGAAASGDEDADAYRKNLIKLEHPNINLKSVCVRVNGTPVHYLSVKGHSDEVIIGAVAGAKAKVTVRYCTGKLTGCEHAAVAEDCSVPKDEFMEAIGGGTGEGADPRLGQWDPSAPADKEADVMARLDGSIKKELETNDDLNGRAPKGDLFKDWISDNGTTACGTTQASN